MSRLKKGLALVLTLCMMLSLMPVITPSAEAADDTTFTRVFLLDCGRKYFSVTEIEGIIDELADNDYTHLQLAFGNDALRFLLDDMSVGTYTSSEVTNAIQSANASYATSKSTNSSTLSQSDMDTIISYATSKGISIIPLLNTPGHMTALISAMKTLGVSTSASFSLTDTNQVNFVKTLVGKYITYFSGKGCQYFHMGADEYSFSSLDSTGYTAFVEYINDIASAITTAGMKPIAFNDGIYYKSSDSDFAAAADKISKSIIVAYWAKETNYASAATLADKGFTLLNNNADWYYVLGDALYTAWYPNGQWGYEDSKKALQEKSCTTLVDGSVVSVAGSVLSVWCDYPSYAYESEKVYDLIATMATSNPDYFSISGSTDTPTGTEVTEESVTVSAGGTYTVTITGANYAGTYDTEDTSIATVEVTGTDASEATATYTKVTSNPNWNTLISNNTTSATSYYYLAGDGQYYQLYVTRSNGTQYNRYNYSLGYYANGSSTLMSVASATNSRSNSAVSNVTLYTKSGTEATPASTTITFKGVSVGTTYVTVGSVHYTIKVIAESLDGVSDLPIQLWNTSSPISVTGVTTATSGTFWPYGTQPAYYASIEAEDAYGINGVELSTLVPTGIKDGAVTTNTDPTATYSLYKGTVLYKSTTGLQQVWQDNISSAEGRVDYTYVRYYDGEWAVSADRVNWTTVTGAGSTVSSGSCTEQIIAYYYQRTEITDQVMTDIVDGGSILKNTTSSTMSDWEGLTALDFAVNVNGTQTPNSFGIADKTLLFHCRGTGDTGSASTYRRLNAIRATETSDYEVYMITITPTTDSGTTFTTGTVPTTYTYAGTERVVWSESEDAIPDGYKTIADSDYSSNSNAGPVSYGGEPVIDELYIYNLQGMLVTYYVRGKQTEDSLQVKYVDDTTGDTFYTANFAVLVETGKTKTFNDSLLDAAGNAYVVPGNTTLDDNTYYIVDPYNAKIYVRSDLTKIPDLHGVYTTGIYTQVKAEIDPANPKVLILHYTYDPTAATYKNFVVDFGLPVTVTVAQLFENTADINSITASRDGTYGTVTASGTSFTYTPTAILRNTDVVTITVTYKDNTTSDFKIGFVPATTVYYEEGFAEGFSYTGAYMTQKASKVGDKANYGYDDAYTGTSYQSQYGTQLTGTATFEFTGTGLDIYARSTEGTGTLMIMIKQDGQLKKVLSVDTKMQEGETAITAVPDTAYNVPVASITDLAYGSYTVEMTNVKSGSAGVKPVYIDGFRVYGTLEDEAINANYTKDLEENPTFIELRDKVLASLNAVSFSSEQYADQIAANTLSQVYSTASSTEGAVIVGNTPYTENQLKDLLDNGPKNEIYLRNGQSLVFNVTTERVVQIGLKALDTATSYKINNGTEQTLNSSTDMFYKVLDKDSSRTSAQTITITNTGSGILSVTKLKVCDDPNAALGTLTADDLIPALVDLGIVETAEESGGSGSSGSSGGSAGGIGGGGGGGGGGAAAPVEPSEPTTPPAEDDSLPFTDVSAGDWFRDSVKYVYSKGLMNGTSETTFSPLQTTNRAMIVTILHRLENSPAPDGQAPFADVPADQYYANPVAWAAANGIVTGTSETTFSPLNNITREQLAAILYRYAQYKGYDVSVGEDTNILSFTDAETISEYAIPAIQWAVGAGLINGKGDGCLDPQGSATRAEVSAILARFCEAYAG